MIEYTILNDKHLVIVLEGNFLIETSLIESLNLPFENVIQKIESLCQIQKLKIVDFDATALKNWDSSILTFILHIKAHCLKNDIIFIKDSLPSGIQRVLSLAEAVPERKGIRKSEIKTSLLASIGNSSVKFITLSLEMLEFFGEIILAFLRLIFGKYKIRSSVLVPIISECSVGALPIVSLISSLVGLILAFVGAVQLVMFGAQIYVASLVGIAMIRVMGAVMVGVIMAGRTGAAFAAQLGTMEVNEEIDALRTLGISPIEFLVIPRILALSFIMPLLCLYADLMGVLGGMAVGIFMLDLNVMEYYNMTRDSVSLNSFWIGIFQSFVFGIVVALAGCLRGMQCKRSASAVGEAATSAVVTGIVAIVITTAVITVLCNVVGI